MPPLGRWRLLLGWFRRRRGNPDLIDTIIAVDCGENDFLSFPGIIRFEGLLNGHLNIVLWCLCWHWLNLAHAKHSHILAIFLKVRCSYSDAFNISREHLCARRWPVAGGNFYDTLELQLVWALRLCATQGSRLLLLLVDAILSTFCLLLFRRSFPKQSMPDLCRRIAILATCGICRTILSITCIGDIRFTAGAWHEPNLLLNLLGRQRKLVPTLRPCL